MKAVKRVLSVFLCICLMTGFLSGLSLMQAYAAQDIDAIPVGADAEAADVGVQDELAPEAAAVDAAEEGGQVEIQSVGKTYYLDVGDTQTIYLNEYSSDIIAGSVRWISNAPFDVEVDFYCDTYCRIKVNRYISMTVIVQATYSRWIKDTMNGTKYRGSGFKDFYVEVNEPKKVKVTFNANGGSVSPSYSTIYKGGTLSSLPTPSYSGYSFDGWYTSMYGGTKVTLSRTYDDNTTIYAHWTKKSSSSGGSSSGTSQNTVADPEITSLDSGREGITITWRPVAGASKYRVYYKDSSGSWKRFSKDVSGNSMVDSGVVYLRKETYTIRALDASGNLISGYKKDGWSTYYGVGTPQITSVTSSADGIIIKWNSVGDATTYRVYYKDSSGNWKRFASDVKGYTKIDAGVVYGRAETYTVRAVNNKGEVMSGYNSTGKKITYGSDVDIPQITGLTCTEDGITIKWNSVGDATTYRVYYKDASGNWKRFAGDVKGNTKLDTGVVYGRAETYTVRAVNKKGDVMSGYVSAGKKIVYGLNTPKITGFETEGSGVRIRWDAVDGASTYRLYYKGSSGWTKIADVKGTSYLYRSASAQGYTYTIKCVNPAGTKAISGYNSTGWKYEYPLKTPVITGFSDAADGVKITWNSVAGAGKYRVYCKDSGSWTKIGETADTSYMYAGARTGKKLTYTVRCLNEDGSGFASDYNHDGWAHTFSLSLDTPFFVDYETTADGILLEWNAVRGATKYRIFYKNASGSWTRMVDVTGTSYLDEDVVYGGSYIYTIRCITTNGLDYISSYDSDGIECIYWSVPEITNAYLSSGRLYVSISDFHTSDSYLIYVDDGDEWEYLGYIESKSGSVNVGNYLTAGRTYTFTVLGYDDTLEEGDSFYYPDGFTFRM